jgi:hypothetical protein
LDRRYLGWEGFRSCPTAWSSFAGELQAVLRGPLSQLGIAIQIGHLRLTGTPMNSVQMIPQEVLALVGD